MESKLVTKYGKSFTQLPNTFIMNPSVSSDAKCLMLLLQQYAWTSDEVFPAVDTILYHLNWGRTKYNTARKELEEKGFIEVRRMKNEKGIFTHNVYTLDPTHIYEEDTATVKSINSPSISGSSINGERTTNNTNINNNTNIYNNTNNSSNSLKQLKQFKNSNTKTGQLNEEIYDEIISYLNSKTGKNFKTNSKTTIKLIDERFSEGFTIDDFKTVIDNKCSSWLNDSKMDEYLRPRTLFSTNFESYLNERPSQNKSNKKVTYDVPKSNSTYNTNNRRMGEM